MSSQSLHFIKDISAAERVFFFFFLTRQKRLSRRGFVVINHLLGIYHTFLTAQTSISDSHDKARDVSWFCYSSKSVLCILCIVKACILIFIFNLNAFALLNPAQSAGIYESYFCHLSTKDINS